jgi:hypothetical protein
MADIASMNPTALLLDPALQFVTGLLSQNGGAYGMAKLSGLLKRQAPELRERMGGIKRWIGEVSGLHVRVDPDP